MVKSSSRLMQLLNNGMLNLTLLQQKLLEVSTERVTDFNPIFKEFTELFQELLEQKSIQLKIGADPKGDQRDIELLQS